jgi:dimethylargininase
VILAITRPVSPTFAACALTHLARSPIDVDLARRQHAAYESALQVAGAVVLQVPAAPAMPDAVFIEDTALVLDEVAVITRPGAESRRGEIAAVAPVLGQYRSLLQLEAPALLDGGDVLCIGRRLYVGLSLRSNPAAVAQLGRLLAPYGYTVAGVPITGCLHLKSAVTLVADDLLLLNPAWVDPDAFDDVRHAAVAADEPGAANALRVGGTVIFPSHFPGTAASLRRLGLDVVTVDCSEIAKAEGAVTCCSLLVRLD